MLVDCGSKLQHMGPGEIGSTMCKNAFKNDTAALEALLAAGVDCNAADYDGRTGLMVAAAQGAVETAKMLLEQPGIDASRKDIGGATAAEEAQKHNQPLIVALFK